MVDYFFDHERNNLHEELIVQVEKRQLLWDPRHKLYRNKKASEKCWVEVAAALQISEAAAKWKWKMLRTVFQRHVKKYNPKNLDDYTGKWHYFPALWYLHDAVLTRKTVKTYFKRRIPDSHRSDNSEKEDSGEEEREDPKLKRRRVSSIEKDEDLSESVDLDSDDLFLKSLVPFLKKLSPMRKLIVRSQFQNILMSEMINVTN